MAEIFRGKAVAGRGFEKPVAIKRILPHLSQDSRFVELLITEAKTLSELRHRNIVQIYDVGLGDDGQYFLVMEFVDGLDLADLFDHFASQRGQALPQDVALYIGAQVCEALEHAHAARDSDGKLINLVHRDVSPSNILLSKSGEVKLTDFGIAKRVEEMTGHGGVRGKFAYIAPEQAENKHVDGRSDVHSLAMVLFELLTGKNLFSHLPDFDALRMVRDHKIPVLSSVEPRIAPALNDVIMRALRPSPSDRYQSAGEFATALRDFRYSLTSSTGDPVQAVARAVRESISPRAPAVGFDDSLPPGEGTVVRIISSEGLGKWPDDEIETGKSSRAPGRPIDPDEVVTDGETRALSALDSSFEQDRTRMAQKVASRRASSAEGSTQLAPRSARSMVEGKRSRISSSTSVKRVDVDADTEWATMSAKPDGDLRAGLPSNLRNDSEDDDVDDEGNVATRILDRSNSGSVASFLAEREKSAERKKRKTALPSPSRDEQRISESVETVEDPMTVPRLDPVRDLSEPQLPQTMSSVSSPGSSSSVPAGMAPREPNYPGHQQHVPHVGPSDDQFLGMPRYLAYWVIGIAGVTLLLIIIVLLATRPSSAPPAAPATPKTSLLEHDVIESVREVSVLVATSDQKIKGGSGYSLSTRQSESTNQPFESVHSTSIENPVASASELTSERKYL